MKTGMLSTVLSPSVIVMGVLAIAVLAIVLTGARVPLLSNPHVSLVLFVALGMAMCSSGIGRVAAVNEWMHPLTIVGYVLGALILAVAVAAFLNVKMPLVTNSDQAVIVMAILAGAKVINSVVHSLISGG